MYILEKYSMPGWKLEADDIENIRWMLEQWVCDWCKWTEKDYAVLDQTEKEQWAEPDTPEGVNPFTLMGFFPENYSELSDKEKIILLLNTACGCEYGFEEKEAE